MIVCRTCGRNLPEEAYYFKTSKTVCYECVKKRQAEYQRQISVKARMAESRKKKAELKKRFDKVMALKNFDTNNLDAGRDYIEAYVKFFKFAEGEDDHHKKETHDKKAHH